jgi:NADH-quinone oxidoreductase subunit D
MQNIEETVNKTEEPVFKTEEFFVSMGPQHPSTHGVLKLLLKMDGERCVETVPEVGFLHRAIEKMAENRTYLQIIPLTDRLDYVTSMAGNFSYCLAVERLAGIRIPPRAEHIRVLMMELNRIASHLLWYGTMGLEVGATTPFLFSFREREDILDLFETACGARLTYNFFRIGGVSRDLPEGFVEKTRQFLGKLKTAAKDYEGLLTENVIFLNRSKNIGVITKEQAVSYGLTGPNLRASGVKWDLRRDDPYSIYPDLDFDIPVGTAGDIWDRYRMRLDEIYHSMRIVEQCLEKMPKGEVRVPVHMCLTPPPGEIYSRIESSRGEMGTYIVSDGSSKPYRVKFRAPSFSNLSIVPEILKDVFVADLVVICGSLDIVLPEVDR